MLRGRTKEQQDFKYCENRHLLLVIRDITGTLQLGGDRAKTGLAGKIPSKVPKKKADERAQCKKKI